jgi:lysozyme family protein
MDAWDKAIKFVLSYEGGYVNDPNDAGGETNFGISKRSYPSLDIKALTVDQARDIYKRDFWTTVCADQLPENLAIAAFDCAVNQGVGIASRLIQVALGVAVDGVIGPKTIGAAYRAGDYGVWLFLLERAKRYMQTQGVQTWGANWGERLVRLGKAIFIEPEKEAWPIH